tara:strand:- start:15338 stop:15892 length:555 start_codon:yes stop_codon:yes gene_type:complete
MVSPVRVMHRVIPSMVDNGKVYRNDNLVFGYSNGLYYRIVLTEEPFGTQDWIVETIETSSTMSCFREDDLELTLTPFNVNYDFDLVQKVAEPEIGTVEDVDRDLIIALMEYGFRERMVSNRLSSISGMTVCMGGVAKYLSYYSTLLDDAGIEVEFESSFLTIGKNGLVLHSGIVDSKDKFFVRL